MRADKSSSYKQVGGASDFAAVPPLLAGSSAGTAAQLARVVPIGPGRALLIYLKHRGVLNVEEFRRTNARGL